MRKLKLFFACLLMAVLSIGQVWATDVDDELTASLFTATSTTYSDFTGVAGPSSDAVYAGNSAKTSSGGIQLRSKNSNSGIVSTTSGGKVKSVAIVVESGSNTMDVYGSNTAYSSAADLYGSNKGTKLGSLSADGSIDVDGDYEYIGIRSNNGALYLTSITITWDDGQGGGVTPSKTDVTDEQLSWSAASATVTFGETPYSLPSLTNTIQVNVSYQSTDETVATISNTGVVNILKAGSTTIKAVYAGSETLKEKTVSYTLTVNKAPLSPIVGGIQDVLNYSWHGKTSTTYGDVTAKTANNTGHSTAKYAANCAGGNTSIQLRSTNNSGFISTVSAGYVKRVEIEWNDNTAAGRTLDIYGSNTAYTAVSQLYNSTTDGDLLGSLNIDAEETVLDFTDWTGDYKYIGFRSRSGAMFINSVTITWVPLPTYAVNLSNTGCTLNVQKGSTPVADDDKFEEGTQLAVSYSASEGYENASLKVKKTSDMSDVTTSVLSGSTLTMPAYGITIEATATKKSYTVTLAATNGKIQVGGVDKTSITVGHGDEVTLSADADDNYAFQNWTSSDYIIATPTTNPLSITIEKAGTITANFYSTAKTNPNLSWNAANVEAVKGQAAPTWPVLTNSYSLGVTYSSTNPDVATISNTGEVSIVGVGSTTIKATYAEDQTYSASEASYTLTVKGRVTWHAKKAGVDATTYADYVKDAVPIKPTGDFIASCHSSISLVGWTNAAYEKSDFAPTPLYTEDVPAVTDNADYYAVWANVEEGGWNEITSVPTAGTYAIYAEGYFLKAEISDKNRFNNGNDGTNIVADGKLTEVPTNCQWEISINAGGKFLLKNGTNYAGALDEKNKGALLTDNTSAFAQWEITYGTGYVVKNVGRATSSTNPDNAYLRQNGESGWATYASGTGDAPRFFKYSAGSTTGYTTNCVEPMTIATPTFTPNGSAAYYTEAQNVTVSCATEGSVIYYTLDNTTPSKTNGTQYTAAINVAETKTIKAIAYVGDVASEVATATFTINLPLTGIPAIFNAATTTATAKVITFDNTWVVSGVKSDGTQAFLTDGTNGIILFHKNVDMQLEVGNTLSGTKECSLILFNGAAELQDFSTEGLTVGTNGVVTPVSKSIADLGGVNTGAPVIISNVTYNGTNSTLVDEDVNAIKPYTTLYNYGSTFVNNKIYSVTGIYLQYNNTKELLPRQSEDIVLESKEQPTLKWYVSNTKETEIGATYTINEDDVFAPYFESNSDGAKTYSSTVGTVASIDPSTGALSIEGVGETVISCAVEADGDYLAGSKSFTLKVRAAGSGDATWVAKDWAESEGIESNTNFSGNYETIDIDANVSMTWAKVTSGATVPAYNYGDKEGRLYANTSLTFASSNSKQITRVVFHFTTNYSGTISANIGSYENAEWNGFASSVTFTNASGQARIKSIDIEYEQGITSTLVIDDIELSMLSPAAQDIAYTSNRMNPTIVYSDYDDEIISISNGQIAPLAVGSTTVTASIAAAAPYSSVVTTFNVTVKSGQEVEESVVILAKKDGVWYALTNIQGSANNSLAGLEVDYFEPAGKILSELTDAQKTSITWKRITDGNSVTFQDANDKYLTGNGTSTNLSVAAEKCVWTKEDNDYWQINQTTKRTFLYISTDTYNYFRCYTATTGNVSGLPIFVASENIYGTTYTRPVTEGRYGTICLPKDGMMIGASIFEIAYFGQASNKVFFDEVLNGEMEAGMPYIFMPNEGVTELKVVYTNSAEEVAKSKNGLHGTLEAMQNIAASDNIYLVYQNQILHSTVDGSSLAANRAYIKIDEINPKEQALAPGRRRVSMGVQGEQIATGFEELNASEKPVKLLIEGKIYILRGEKMYDATGRLVK